MGTTRRVERPTGARFVRDEWLDEVEARLHPGESVLMTVRARMQQQTHSILDSPLVYGQPKYLGFATITDDRIILFAKRPKHGHIIEDYRYDSITNVEEVQGWTSGAFRIHSAGGMRVVDAVPNEEVVPAIQLIRSQITRVNQVSPTSVSSPLEALKLRLAKGEIGAEEYEKLRRILEST